MDSTFVYFVLVFSAPLILHLGYAVSVPVSHSILLFHSLSLHTLQSNDGQYDDMSTCEDSCKAATFARCNLATHQCEECTQGSPNCTQTQPQCQATCSQPRAKCNLTTHQCVECDPNTDPDCIDTKGSCAEKCNKQSTYGICDPTTGQCVPCDPTQKEVRAAWVWGLGGWWVS